MAMIKPKTLYDLASQIRFHEMTIFEGNDIGSYNPVLGIGIKTEEAMKQPGGLIPTLLHEATHKFIPKVTDKQYKTALNELELLNTNFKSYFEELKSKYSEKELKSEILSRFIQSNPNEVLNPTTETGKLINQAFSENLGWNKNVNDLVKILKEDLKDVNKDNMKPISKNLVWAFLERFKSKVENGIRETYIRAKNTIARENKVKLDVNSEDEMIINQYSNSELLWKSYAGFAEQVNKKINSILASNFENNVFNVEQTRKDLLKEVPELTKSRANMIIRTEYNNIRKISMEKTYNIIDPEGNMKFKWVGPNDHRTTDICKRIKQRTAKGVSLEELKEIIKEEADPKTYTSLRPFMPHLQCRHTYIQA